MSNQTLLEMKHIRKQFPEVLALKDISIAVMAGEVHALLGENGAGKSTLIKVLGGIYSMDGGEIFIEGSKTDIHTVHDAQANGINVIHQELVLVPKMTVAENIFLGREPVRHGTVDRIRMNADAKTLLDSFDLDIDPDINLGELTIAQQQMVEITKALSFNSRILVMDEPTSSLSEKEVNFLFDTIRKLKKRGVGIIYISHRMSELFEISDRVTVMRDGEYIGTVITQEATPERLITMMVGRKLTSYYTRTYSRLSEKILEVKHLSDGKLLNDVSFDLYKGEILGFAGLVGAGRSEVMKCIFGLAPFTEGHIIIEGKQVRIQNASEAMAHGLALVPESRKKEALFPVQSVKFNISIRILSRFIKGIFVNDRREEAITNNYIRQLSIKTPSSEQTIGNLSGGNQQKVVIGRWLATTPKILILDEPTRGVDVGAKAEIYAIMNKLAAQGMAIIMISSELPEVINMSDRVVVMCNGSVTGCLPKEELNQEKIMHLATLHGMPVQS
ncbi:sugar ABC transporter ATP-binding protein [Sediminispirochaeta smaragdinae]|uniref:ABC transporter related protein n=1 Tax=Sediminispirochaeta smaragdinae (strain DSM 11293 / JCM 15392 / SEBR 4228) TaxID=573413 RepID=E1R8Q6_SEDSS|nr:sugar ABC transporter ATP-binding protein [Sediminispirochaeta smaragdinae]ADK81813.1 ABC transporter related protein [Sediminispirochaeta smaragdinae DSM 11293]